FCCSGAWDQMCTEEATAVCPNVNCLGPCSAETCPYGCCDAMGKCKQDGCEFWGVPCGGDTIPGGSPCEDCYNGACETACGQTWSVCTPDCANKKCGDPDGCGSRCDGPCAAGEFCSISAGACESTCDTITCANGCCDLAGKCQPGLDDAQCGEGG